MADTHLNVMTREKQLVDHLRELVKPIRKQEESKEEQATCLYDLGKLYVQKATEYKNCDDFTKASGLFNAALIRTSNEDLQTEVKRSISELRNHFLESHFVMKHARSREWEQRVLKNKQILMKVRQVIEDECTDMKNIIETYDDEMENRQEREKTLVKEAKRVSLVVQEEMTHFIRMLWQQSLDDVVFKPPCNYSVLGLGSLARQEVTPHSDLEFAILVEEQTDEIQEFFKKLTHVFHLNVLDLGETPLPILAILSLNDYTTPGGDWFYDKITPSGFKLDGAMPWACKTPIGRKATLAKEPLSLIKTPTEMAELLRTENKLGQAYHVSDVLSHAIHLYGDNHLYQMYMQEYLQIVESESEKFKKRGLLNWINDLTQFRMKVGHSVGFVSAKLYVYRFASTSMENMRQYLTPCFLGSSHWDTIEHLHGEKYLSDEQGFNISVALAISFAMRLLTYLFYKGQHETILTFRSDLSCTDNTVNLVQFKDYQGNRNIICLFHTFNCAVFGLFKTFNTSKLASELLGSPPFQKFSGQTLNDAFRVIPVYRLHLSDNFYWAEKDEDIPSPHCGLHCQRHIAHDLEATEKPLPVIDSLLQKANNCICVSTLEIHLKIYKYFLTRSFGDTEIIEILDKVEETKSERERCFLILGLLQLMDPSINEECVRSVVGYAEDFLGNVENLPDEARSIFQEIRFRFQWAIMEVYDILGEMEKLVQLCSAIVEELEKPIQHESVSPYIAMVYKRQGMTLFKMNNRQEEAIDIYRKALKIMQKFRYYIRPATQFSNTILEFANMLKTKHRYNEAIEVLTSYFFNVNNSFRFTNAEILKASGELATCYISSKTLPKAVEVLEKASQMVNSEGLGGELSDVERYHMARDLYDCYTLRARFQDIPDVIKFHNAMCMAQTNKDLGRIEHQLFLLNISVELIFWGASTGFDLSQGLGVKAFMWAHAQSQPQRGAETTNLTHKDKATWLDAVIALCDEFMVYTNPKAIHLIYDISLRVDEILEAAINAKQLGILPNLLTVYLDYRRCPLILDWSLRNKRFLLYTIYFLQQTLVLIQLYFSHTKTPERWVSQAVNKCTVHVKTVLSQKRKAPPNLISDLISRRKIFVETAAKTRLFPYIGCKLKNIIRHI